MTKDIKLDQRGDGLYSGTFRWTQGKKFPPLPPFPCSLPNLSKGWGGYLDGRGGPQLRNLVQNDPSILDALSFPITIINMIQTLFEIPTHKELPLKLQIVVIGATVKAEQRILQNSEYWGEISHFFKGISFDLWFVGPEVEQNKTLCDASENMNCINVQSFRGTVGDFHSGNKITTDNSIVIGYNTGFGNFIESNRYDLFWSWVPDLYLLAALNIPVVFACANDYADLHGEFFVQMKLIGANFLILPMENQFSAASHLHEEGKRDESWSRGNSFLYVIKGFDSNRQVHKEEIKKYNDRENSLLEELHKEKKFAARDMLGRVFYQGTVLSKDRAEKHSIKLDHDAWGGKMSCSCKTVANNKTCEPLSEISKFASVPVKSSGGIKYMFGRETSVNKGVVVVVLKVYLPDICSMQEIELKVSTKQLVLVRFDPMEKVLLNINLPENVNPTVSNAVFLKKKKILKVFFPTVDESK